MGAECNLSRLFCRWPHSACNRLPLSTTSGSHTGIATGLDVHMVMGTDEKEASTHRLFILRGTVPIELEIVIVQDITPAIKLDQSIE